MGANYSPEVSRLALKPFGALDKFRNFKFKRLL